MKIVALLVRGEVDLAGASRSILGILGILAHPDMLMLTAALVAIASVGKKVSGALAGGRLGGMSFAESLAIGCGMNARSSTEIIIATVGLTATVRNRGLFTAIVMMAVIMTLMMPPTLRWAFRRLPMGEQERLRLEREAAEAAGYASKIERILLAVDASRSGRLASHLVGLLAGIRGVPTTALHLDQETGLHAEARQAQARRTSDAVSGAADAVRGGIA